MRAWVLTLCAAMSSAVPAGAFPGLVIAKDESIRTVRSTKLVVMQRTGHSVVTIMAEVEGPAAPFALLVPVPSDVTANGLRTVRRNTLARLEALTAPRYHAFYEQDPCGGATVEQAWDEHVKAGGRGFLTPDFLPPADRHYAVSNAISTPIAPTFKGSEGEFRYELVELEPRALARALTRHGLHADPAALSALAEHAPPHGKVLLAEVDPAHVELTAEGRLQLGGIRFATRQPWTSFAESAFATKAAGTEELFVYVFDREARYAVKDQASVFLPNNIAVESRAAARLGAEYGALFDAFAQSAPGAYALEYAWSTSGCGEPCPDVPLGVDELMTLGADVLEAEATTPLERRIDAGSEPVLERERFESHLAELPAAERPAAAREHAAERREIALRLALARRHTYVLTRLHGRRLVSAAPRTIELASAPALTGGTGIPRSLAGELSTATEPADENRFQVRFVALEPWTRAVECSEPKRGRWGKRWASEARVARAVPLATELTTTASDRNLLESVLIRSLPSLGLTAGARTPQKAEAPSPAASGGAARSEPSRGRSGCVLATPRGEERGVLAVLLAFAAGLLGRRRYPAKPSREGPRFSGR
jgi:hypothetical protein